MVNADEEAASAIFLQVGTEGAELLGRLHVAVAGAGRSVIFEKDDAAHMVVADVADYVVLFVDGSATETYKEYFSDILQKLFVTVGHGDGIRHLLVVSVLATGYGGEG